MAEALDRRAGAGSFGIGVADGRFAAGLAARAAAAGEGGPVVVAPGESAAFLAPFPVALLDDPDLADLLPRLGLRTLGALAALPATDVVARFGPAGRLAHRRASGLDDRPVDARPPPPDLAVHLELDPPVTDLGPVAFAGKHLADELHERLAARGLACTRLVVVAETEHGERHERLWRHEHAFTAAALTERVRWQLEGWATGRPAPRPPAASCCCAWCPTRWCPTPAASWRSGAAAPRPTSGPGGPPPGSWACSGPRPSPCPSGGAAGIPAAAVVPVPVAAVDLAERRRGWRRPPGSGPWPGSVPAPSPASVLADPLPAEVVDAAGAPVAVDGRSLVSAPPARLAVAGAPGAGGGGVGRAVAGRRAVVGPGRSPAPGPLPARHRRRRRPPRRPRGRAVVGGGHLRLSHAAPPRRLD